MAIFPHDFFLCMSRAWRKLTHVLKKWSEDTPSFFKLLLKMLSRESPFWLLIMLKNQEQRNTLSMFSAEKAIQGLLQKRDGDTPRPSTLLRSSLSCLVPLHSLLQSFLPLLFALFPPPNPARVHRSCPNWACPSVAGKPFLKAGNQRNSSLVVFSLFMWT